MLRSTLLSRWIPSAFNSSKLATCILGSMAAFMLAAAHSTAHAQTCSFTSPPQGNFTLSLSIPGLPNNGLYTPVCYSWGPSAASTGQGVSRELTVTTSTDSSVAAEITAAQAGQLFPSAELQQVVNVSQSAAIVDIQMTNVRIESVQITGDSETPQTTLVLKFDSVVFTFQTLLPNGQKSGPPVNFSVTFKK